jgi:hypothetical protein
LTLPQRLSRDALTIRACSRATCRRQRFQSIWPQCAMATEDARVVRVHLRFPHKMLLPAFSSFMTCWKSSCLSQGSCHFLYPPITGRPLLFPASSPANRSATLATRFPRKCWACQPG